MTGDDFRARVKDATKVIDARVRVGLRRWLRRYHKDTDINFPVDISKLGIKRLLLLVDDCGADSKKLKEEMRGKALTDW